MPGVFGNHQGYTIRNCKCKPVRASFSSCLGQLLSKIFGFFCVPLTLLVWVLNAWFGLCLECSGITRDTQSEIANASQCEQASAAALANCFRRSSTSSAFRWRSWSESLMLDSVYVWSVRESPGIHNQKLQMQASASMLCQTQTKQTCISMPASTPGCLVAIAPLPGLGATTPEEMLKYYMLLLNLTSHMSVLLFSFSL